MAVIATFVLAANGNAPAPQYTGPHSRIHLTSQGDVSGWNFFLVSGDKVRETGTSGAGWGDTPLGTDLASSVAICYAVPSEQLAGYERQPDGQFAPKVLADIAHERIPGMFEIFRHRFFDEQQTDSPEMLLNDYTIEIRNGKPALFTKPSPSPASSIPAIEQTNPQPKTPAAETGSAVAIVAGVAGTVVLIVVGLVLFRRRAS
jgi:hypothetical protein